MDKKRSLADIIREALDCAKKAKSSNKSLSGDNHYGNKFNSLKIEATNLFQQMYFPQSEKSAVIGELLDLIFAQKSSGRSRLDASREMDYLLKTSNVHASKLENFSIKNFISVALLDESRRGYLQRLGNEINSSYRAECYTSCMVMIRRLMEVCIIEVYEGNGLQAKIKGADDNYLMLENLVDKLINEKTIRLSRPSKASLPHLRTFGNLSAHGKHFHARKDDLDKIATDFRALVEEMLRLAKLIT